MTLFLNNKFNVIHKLEKDKEFDYNSNVLNFVEKYLESEISIIHPAFLYQKTYNNEYQKTDNQILVIFKNYLKKLKVNIKKNIKNDNFSIDNELNKIIKNYIHKINYLNSILKINKSEFFNLFHNIIIYDQIIISFIEVELTTLINNNSSEIKILLENIKVINEENIKNYIWFLNLIGTILKNSIPQIKENINNKQLYEIKLLTDYIINVKNKYNFIGIDTEHISKPIIEIYIDKIKTFINSVNEFDDFYFLIEYFWKDINNVLFFNNENITTIKNVIAIKVQKKIQQLDDNTQECFKIIKLIILLNDYKIAENQLFLLFNNDKINNYIIKFISYNIINDIDITNKLILLLTSIKEKDVFIQKYHDELIKRLLSMKTTITAEKILNETMIKIFGEKEVKKIYKCINDYELSFEHLNTYLSYEQINQSLSTEQINQSLSTEQMNQSLSIEQMNQNLSYEQMNMYNTLNFTISLVTTSYDAWNINYNNGFLDKFNEDINYKKGLLNFINSYNKFYKSIINDKKKLIWLLQYGEVTVNYNNYTLKMLPIQLLILELFNYNNSLKLKDILSNKLLANYQSDYLNKIIISLVISGLLINNNNVLILSMSVDNTDLINSYHICTNLNNNCTNLNNNCTNLNNNCTNLNNNCTNLNNNCTNEIISHSRKDVICTLINHFLKKGDKNFDTLLKIISSEIKLFPVDKIILQKAIDYMINQDYIKELNDNYVKIYY